MIVHDRPYELDHESDPEKVTRSSPHPTHSTRTAVQLYGCTRKCTRTRRAIAWCTQISKRQMMNGHILPRLPAGRARLCC
jgi:hypothetical protein